MTTPSLRTTLFGLSQKTEHAINALSLTTIKIGGKKTIVVLVFALIGYFKFDKTIQTDIIT